MDNLKKYGGWVVLIFVMLFASSIGKIVGRSTTQNYFDSKRDGQIEKAQEFAAAELRKQLPMKVDEYTTLQNALSSGKTLVYHYVIAADAIDVDNQSFRTEVNEILNKNVCGSEGMLKVIRAGGSYVYQYVSQDGASIAQFRFDKETCGVP